MCLLGSAARCWKPLVPRDVRPCSAAARLQQHGVVWHHAHASCSLPALPPQVMDDPKLLAASLKRIAKGKAKSAAAWSGRKERTEADKESRAADRNAHLKGKRARGLVDKPRKGAPIASAAAGVGGGTGGGGSAPPTKRAGFEGRTGAGFLGKRAGGGGGGGGGAA